MSKFKLLGLTICAWTLLVPASNATAVPIRIDFSGTAYPLASDDIFDGSSISGHITYDSDSPPTATNQLGYDTRFGDAIIDFGFTIAYADGGTYVSNGLFRNSLGQPLGGIDLSDQHYPEIQFVSQGIFAGNSIDGRAPYGFFFSLIDGNDYGNDYPAGNVSFDTPAAILTATSLPSTGFSVAEVNADPAAVMSATMSLDWGANPYGAPYLGAFYGLTSVTFSVDTGEPEPDPVPEPHTLLLLAGGSVFALGWRRHGQGGR